MGSLRKSAKKTGKLLLPIIMSRIWITNLLKVHKHLKKAIYNPPQKQLFKIVHRLCIFQKNHSYLLVKFYYILA